MTQQPATDSKIDPLIGVPLVRGPEIADLHAKIRAEKRDSQWAPRMESAIRARMSQIPLVEKNGNVLRVTCASTLCEIAGTLVGVGQRPENYDPELPLNKAMIDLQGKALNEDLAKLGLKTEGDTFTGGKGKPDRVVFLLYYSRTK